MSRLILSIITLLACAGASAQLFPLSDYYIYNGLAINPAFAGSHDALSATVQYRDQWVGFHDAPKSAILSLHAPVFNDRMGLGFMVSRNCFGIYRETSIMGNYAYRHELYNGKFSLGIAFGITSYHIAWNDLQANDPDDIILNGNSTSSVLPDFSLGAYYYTEKYFAGISVPFFLSHFPDANSDKLVARNRFSDYNYFVTAGYNLSHFKDINLLPSILLKYNRYARIHVEYYLQAEFFERISAGLGYRNPGMLMGLISCRVNKQLTVAYSYDSDSGKAGNYKNGSHEIVLGYIFRYSREVMGPREF